MKTFVTRAWSTEAESEEGDVWLSNVHAFEFLCEILP